MRKAEESVAEEMERTASTHASRTEESGSRRRRRAEESMRGRIGERVSREWEAEMRERRRREWRRRGVLSEGRASEMAEMKGVRWSGERERARESSSRTAMASVSRSESLFMHRFTRCRTPSDDILLCLLLRRYDFVYYIYNFGFKGKKGREMGVKYLRERWREGRVRGERYHFVHLHFHFHFEKGEARKEKENREARQRD